MARAEEIPSLAAIDFLVKVELLMGELATTVLREGGFSELSVCASIDLWQQGTDLAGGAALAEPDPEL